MSFWDERRSDERSGSPESRWVDRRLIDQHNGDIIFDRVYAPALRAFERIPFWHYRSFTERAHQYIEQFLVDHGRILQDCVLLSHIIKRDWDASQNESTAVSQAPVELL